VPGHVAGNQKEVEPLEEGGTAKIKYYNLI